MHFTSSVPAIRIVNSASRPCFPHQLVLNETEPFTQQTWQELFQKAVSSPVPSYVIAIAQLPPLSSGVRYKIYDGIALRNYQASCTKDGKPFQDLQTRELIQKVYYYAINCFVLIDDKIQPARLEHQTFQPFLPTMTGEKKRIQSVINSRLPSNALVFDRAEAPYWTAMQSVIDKVATDGHVQGAKIRPVIERIQTFALDGVNLHCQDHTVLGQTQHIVGSAWSQLLHRSCHRIWDWCARKHLD